MKKNIDKLMVGVFAKASSVMNDLILIEDDTVFKGNVKRDINRFMDFYKKSTDEIYNIYYKRNAQEFDDLVSQFNSFNETYDLGSKSNSTMSVIYSKLVSVNIDLLSVEFKESEIMYTLSRFLSIQLTSLLQKKFWNVYKPMVNKEGQGIENLTSRIHKFGEMIYT